MKVTFLSTAFCLAFWCSLAVAEISLGLFPNLVYVGESYTLSWTATENYTYTLWLVQQDDENPYSWEKVTGLITSLRFGSLYGSYSWTVPRNLSVQGVYGIWVDGLSIPFDGASYANMTDWFAVSSSPSPTASASSSATASASHSATSTGSTSGASNDTPSSDHKDSISGGAIAGIVIGCLLAVALVIGAILFLRQRKKRSTLQDREAADRANRLAPVMQDAHEMHSRTSQTVKETNV